MKIFRLRTLLISGLILVLLAAGGYAGYRGYRAARQARWLGQARAFLEKGKAQQARICLQSVLSRDPNNLEALRLMATVPGVAGSPSALLLRSRVVELNPDSLEDRLALASAALAARPLSVSQISMATNALAGVKAADKKAAAFHNVAGAVAITLNQFEAAEAHFLQAANLEPTNAVPRLNLAVLRLQRTNEQAVTEARSTLKELSAHPALRCQALRELAVDAARHNQTNTALALSAELMQQTNSSFSDRLFRLGLLQSARNPEFHSALAACKTEASKNPTNICELTAWQMTRVYPTNVLNQGELLKIYPTNVLHWLLTIPTQVRTNREVSFWLARCWLWAAEEPIRASETPQQARAERLDHWQNLANFLGTNQWGDLEFVRYAYRTRALRALDLQEAAKVEWDRTMKTAAGNKAALSMLWPLAAEWNWMSETEEILWTIVNRYPNDKPALNVLMDYLLANRRTRSFLTLLNQQGKANSSDPLPKNSLILAALLLDEQEYKPHDLAREGYTKMPTNASSACIYAFSLYLQQKNAEAMKLLDSLKPLQQEDPCRTAFCGMVLRRLGDATQAKRYEDFLWSAVNQNPNAQWATRALGETLYMGGQTRPLLKLYEAQAKLNPTDLSVKNNLVMLALLLDAKEFQPHEMARAVYAAAPTNSYYASTFAFSLYLQQKYAEALKVYEQMKPEELQDPSKAAYYGLILKASGDVSKARRYIEAGLRARLLPEEKKLLDQAKAGI